MCSAPAGVVAVATNTVARIPGVRRTKDKANLEHRTNSAKS
jgi:hypothetical protein